MKKAMVQKIVLSFCLLLLSSFFSEKCRAFDLFSKSSEKTEKVAVPDEKKDRNTESIFDKKSLFEEDAAQIQSDDDQKLKAPPNFGDGGDYDAGGQIGPNVPLSDSFLLLILLITGYAFRLLYVRKYPGKKRILDLFK